MNGAVYQGDVGSIDRTARGAGIVFALFATAVALFATSVAPLGPKGALALPPPRPGMRPEFGVSAYFLGIPRYLAETPIAVRVWGAPQYDSLTVGTVRVEFPSEVAWVSGDTLRRVLISPYSRRSMGDRSWILAVRPEQTGRCELKLSLQVQLAAGLGVDETDLVIPLEVRTDSVRVLGPEHPTRVERVRDGQRFRYADGYLVPIEASEALLESEITAKPRVLSPPPEAIPETIPFVAMIGKDGRLLAAEFIEEPGGKPYDSNQVGRARLALDDWKFAPAQAHGHAVADYLIVRVPLGHAG